MAALQQIFLGYSASSTTPVLDQISTSAYAAFSSRKLRAAFSGSAFSGYNGSTSTDIGFSGNDLDTSALAAVGTNVDLTKWYDQSGNTRDLSWISGARTNLRASSVNRTVNSKVATYWAGGSATRHTFGGMNTTTCRTIVAVVQTTNGTSANAIHAGDSQNGGLQFRFSGTSIGLIQQNTAVIAEPATTINNNQTYVLMGQYNASGGAYAFSKDGTSVSTGTNGKTISAMSVLVGCNPNSGGYNSEYMIGYICELLVFDTSGAMNSTDLSTVIADQKTYWGV